MEPGRRHELLMILGDATGGNYTEGTNPRQRLAQGRLTLETPNLGAFGALQGLKSGSSRVSTQAKASKFPNSSFGPLER